MFFRNFHCIKDDHYQLLNSHQPHTCFPTSNSVPGWPTTLGFCRSWRWQIPVPGRSSLQQALSCLERAGPQVWKVTTDTSWFLDCSQEESFPCVSESFVLSYKSLQLIDCFSELATIRDYLGLYFSKQHKSRCSNNVTLECTSPFKQGVCLGRSVKRCFIANFLVTIWLMLIPIVCHFWSLMLLG